MHPRGTPARKMLAIGFLMATVVALTSPQARPEAKPAPSAIEKGQRVFVCGHSFHCFIGRPLKEVADAAGIQGHQLVEVQFLGGSRTLQHWNLPDEKNKAKQALKD